MTGLRFDKLAFTGGSLINQLGPVEDVVCFFKFVEIFAKRLLGRRNNFYFLTESINDICVLKRYKMQLKQ